MNLSIFTEFGPIAIAAVISGVISYFISFLLMKIHRLLIFLIPGILGILSILLLIMGLMAEDWSILGIYILFSFALIGFVGTLVASLILWFRTKKSEN
jgi:hypothetical protein